MYNLALRTATRHARASAALRAPLSTSVIRRNAGPSYQPPTSPAAPQGSGSPDSNAHRDFYKSFGRPTAKVFLMAWATYQILYWSWSKLEFEEEKQEKEADLKRLELELENAVRERDDEKSVAAAAATSGAAVTPGDPLADQVQSPLKKGGSWWKFF